VNDIEYACDSLIVTTMAWQFLKYETHITTFNNGYLGSHHDEERSEMRYVMRIA
jgi:hypothetical protein